MTGTPRTQEEGSYQQVARVAIPFVANSGRSDPSVAYYAQTFSGTVYVTKDGEIVYSLPGRREGEAVAVPRKADRLPASPGWSLTESIVGGKAQPRAIHEAPVRVSYFIGNDRARWKSDLQAYAEVSLGEVWPGVSMELNARARSVEKVFTVEPGANASRIRMRMAGARSLRLNKEGGMVVETGLGEVRFTPPSAYQERRGTRQPVKVAYILKGREYGFRVGGHDPALPVVIDPLVQSTYLGGSGDDFPNALAIHPTSGDVYVTGSTTSTNFPGTAGGAQPVNAGGCGGFTDAFVARLTADLTTLTQATYLGGTCDDYATALAIHPTSGDVYVAGYTNSTDFPGTTGGAQPANGGVPGSFTIDVFAARLTADLTGLTQATYLGGSGNEQAWALAIHPTSGDVYVAGWTFSTNFPVTAGGAQAANASNPDAFIARLTADLTGVTRATYLGSSDTDAALALAIHPTSGDVYVAGMTTSTSFPHTIGGAQALYGGGLRDAFAARLTADLTTLTQASYLGGSGDEYALALAIHPTSGDVYVAGVTVSTDFPGTTGGAQPAHAGVCCSYDAFVARLTLDLAAPAAGFFTLAPCRVADTRGPVGPSGGPTLRANTVRDFPVAGICGIPSSATAVVINLAVVLPSSEGDLRVYPAGRPAPLASTINFRSGIVRANNAIVPLGAAGQLSVQCDMPSGRTHFFFDVYGYFQ